MDSSCCSVAPQLCGQRSGYEVAFGSLKTVEIFLEEMLWNDNCSWSLLKQVHYNIDSTYSLFIMLVLIFASAMLYLLFYNFQPLSEYSCFLKI